MAAAAILKNHENRDISVTVWPIFTKFGKLMQNASLNRSRSLKISNFTNPRWRTAAILKTVKSPNVCNRSTDFDEIWHDDAYWPPTADRPLKFRIFENSRWRQPPCWKSQKSQYIRNGLTDLYEIWYAGAKWVSKPLRPLKPSNFTNPKWRTAAILRTVKAPYLCSRLTDFDEIWQLAPYSGNTIKIPNFWKFKMAAAAVWKMTKIAISPNGLTDL